MARSHGTSARARAAVATERRTILSADDELIPRLRAWTYRRQGLERAAAGPGEALRAAVGVYSSQPPAPLSLLARTGALDAEAFRALERRRDAVRLPAMRQSIFLLPADTAVRVFAATRQPVEKRAGALRYAGLSWDDYAQLKERVLTRVREPMTAGELQAALGTGGDAEARIVTGVRTMAYEGLVLRVGGSLRTDSLRYVATEAWLGRPLEEPDPAESLAWLAGQYLRAFGPARLADFAWWAGVTKTRARAALETGDTEDVGCGLLLPSEDRDAFERAEPLDDEAIDVLPKWDAYTMGHAPDGRRRLVADEYLRRAYSAGGGGTLPGDGYPLVLRGGRAVALWTHRFAGDRMRVEVTPLEPDALPPAVLEGAFDAVGRLLGASEVAVAVAAATA